MYSHSEPAKHYTQTNLAGISRKQCMLSAGYDKIMHGQHGSILQHGSEDGSELEGLDDGSASMQWYLDTAATLVQVAVAPHLRRPTRAKSGRA